MTDTLNRKVAELLTKMGAEWATGKTCPKCGCNASRWHGECLECHTVTQYGPLPFSSSWDAAGRLLDSIKDIVTFYFNAGRWNCQIQKDLKVHEGHGETKMVALCEAFIEAMGGEK